jgi:fatty acid desaturase
MSKQVRKGAKQKTAAQRAAEEARNEKIRRIQAITGAVVVCLVALAAVVMSMLRQIPVPVAVGLVVLVVLRLFILKHELKRQTS